MLTASLDIYKSRCQIIVIPGVVRLLYQHYAHIPLKHNFIYNSVHIKHDGWQFQGLLHLLTVTVCWWPAVYKAVSPCDIIFIQLLLEHPVQVIHTTVDGKTKDFKCKTYIVHNLYTVDRRWCNELVFLHWRESGNDGGEQMWYLKSFQTSQIFLHYRNIPIYKHAHTHWSSLYLPQCWHFPFQHTTIYSPTDNHLFCHWPQPTLPITALKWLT